jgi:predicted transcriptional regulator
MANKEHFSVIQITEALIKAKGFISRAARLLDCTQITVRNYIEKYPELNETLKDCRETFLDLAESKLIQNINNNDNTAIIFFLKTQGGSRGYQEKKEVENETKSMIEINFIDTDNDTD